MDSKPSEGAPRGEMASVTSVDILGRVPRLRRTIITAVGLDEVLMRVEKCYAFIHLHQDASLDAALVSHRRVEEEGKGG